MYTNLYTVCTPHGTAEAQKRPTRAEAWGCARGGRLRLICPYTNSSSTVGHQCGGVGVRHRTRIFRQNLVAHGQLVQNAENGPNMALWWPQAAFEQLNKLALMALRFVGASATRAAACFMHKSTPKAIKNGCFSQFREGTGVRCPRCIKGVLGCRRYRARQVAAGPARAGRHDGVTCRAAGGRAPLRAVEPSHGARQAHVLYVVERHIVAAVAGAYRAAHTLGHVLPPHAAHVSQQQRCAVALAYGP